MKKNVLWFLSLGLLVLSTGCASSKWHQAGKTAAETRADLAECKKLAKAADEAFTIDSAKAREGMVRGCMAMKGYSERGQTNVLTD